MKFEVSMQCWQCSCCVHSTSTATCHLTHSASKWRACTAHRLISHAWNYAVRWLVSGQCEWTVIIRNWCMWEREDHPTINRQREMLDIHNNSRHGTVKTLSPIMTGQREELFLKFAVGRVLHDPAAAAALNDVTVLAFDDPSSLSNGSRRWDKRCNFIRIMREPCPKQKCA